MELSPEERAIVTTVRDFVNNEVRPVAQELEHANAYPERLIEQMKDLGIFGLAIPEPYGYGAVSTPCYALVTEELARGWMSLAGAMGGHTVVAKLINEFGTDEQKETYLPRMATGELRATMALTEPGGGSDLQAMLTTAVSNGSEYVINGAKMWISNARRSDLVACSARLTPRPSLGTPASRFCSSRRFRDSPFHGTFPSWATRASRAARSSSRTRGCPTRHCSVTSKARVSPR